MPESNLPRGVLVVVARRIGDVLLATPVMRSVKRAYPREVLDAAVLEATGGQRAGTVTPSQGEGGCVPCLLERCDRYGNCLVDCLQQLPAALVIAACEQFPGHAAGRPLS